MPEETDPPTDQNAIAAQLVVVDGEDVDAIRINLARIAGAPDAWRARAVSAFGFLGAAAAFSLWGVSQQAAVLGGWTAAVVGAACFCYVAAVLMLLLASIKRTPTFDHSQPTKPADQLHSDATVESEPIGRLVRIGGWFGAGAIVLTAAGAFMVLVVPATSTAKVSFTDDQQLAAAKRLCPTLTNPFIATVTDDGTEYLRLQVRQPQCPEKGTELVVPRSSIIRAESSE